MVVKGLIHSWSGKHTTISRLENWCDHALLVTTVVLYVLLIYVDSWDTVVLFAKGDTVRKIGLNLDLPERWSRVHPKQRWLDTLQQDFKMASLHSDQAFDQEKRRRHSRKADHTTKRDKR